MSDDETSDEPPADPPEDGDEPPADTEEEAEADQPEIEDDERADLDGLREKVSEVSDEVAEEDGLESADDEDDADDDEAADSGDETAASESEDGDTVGDMYAGVVAMLAIAMAEELGDGETDQDADDIAAMLRGERGMPFNVASSVDQLLEESGRGADLPPGKAVVIGTVAAVGMVLLQETDVANSLVSELLSGDL